jgi:hypothetical protein
MSSRLLAGALAAASVATLAPAAEAKTQRTALADSLADGPVLVDGTTLWMDLEAKVRSAGPGTRSRIVASQDLPSNYDDEETGEFRSSRAVSFSASPTHVLIDSRVTSGSRKYSQYSYDLSTAAFPRAGGASRRIGSCQGSVDAFNHPGALGPPDPVSAVDGTTAVASSCPRPVVVDLATGATLRELPELGVEPRLAGRYVASVVIPSTGPKQVLVYDWQAGAEAYRITVAPESGSVSFDLQADGSVALVQFTRPDSPACSTGRLSWHTPAEPVGRALPAAPCAATVAASGGKAAIVADAPPPAPEGNLVVAEVGSDGTRRDLGWLGSGRRRGGAIDYADGTAVYAVLGCNRKLAIMSASGPPESEPLDCLFPRISSARLTGRTLRVRGTVNGTVTRRFTGRLALSYRLGVGKRVFTVRRSVHASAGRFSALLRAPDGVRSRRAARRGRLRVSFAGDDIFRPAAVSRLVVTPRPRGG